MKVAMKCLYWLAKQEIPHTTNYVGLLELVQSLGATYLSDVNLGGNAHYIRALLTGGNELAGRSN